MLNDVICFKKSLCLFIINLITDRPYNIQNYFKLLILVEPNLYLKQCQD